MNFPESTLMALYTVPNCPDPSLPPTTFTHLIFSCRCPQRVGSSLPPGWQDGFRLIYSPSEARVLLIAMGNAFSVLELLYRLNRTWMPFQFELNEVSSYAAHSNYGVELHLHDDFADTSMLEWRSIFTEDL